MRIFTLLLFLLAAFASMAQVTAPGRGRHCATDSYQEVMNSMIRALSNVINWLSSQAVQQAMRRQPKGQYLLQATVTVPVVFHVVYSNQSENIRDEQILSQLAVLNEDFRRINADTVNTPNHFRSLAADTRIEFCLAIVDPQGIYDRHYPHTDYQN